MALRVQGPAARKTPIQATADHMRRMPAEWQTEANRRYQLLAAGMGTDAALMLAVDQTMIMRQITEETAKRASHMTSTQDVADINAERDRAVADLTAKAPAAVYADWKFGDYAAPVN